MQEASPPFWLTLLPRSRAENKLTLKSPTYKTLSFIKFLRQSTEAAPPASHNYGCRGKEKHPPELASRSFRLLTIS